MKNYLVAKFGWEGYENIEEFFDSKYVFYCDTLEEALAEYDRVWEEDLAPDEGALIYDMANNKMIKETNL